MVKDIPFRQLKLCQLLFPVLDFLFSILKLCQRVGLFFQKFGFAFPIFSLAVIKLLQRVMKLLFTFGLFFYQGCSAVRQLCFRVKQLVFSIQQFLLPFLPGLFQLCAAFVKLAFCIGKLCFRRAQLGLGRDKFLARRLQLRAAGVQVRLCRVELLPDLFQRLSKLVYRPLRGRRGHGVFGILRISRKYCRKLGIGFRQLRRHHTHGRQGLRRITGIQRRRQGAMQLYALGIFGVALLIRGFGVFQFLQRSVKCVQSAVIGG